MGGWGWGSSKGSCPPSVFLLRFNIKVHSSPAFLIKKLIAFRGLPIMTKLSGMKFYHIH